MRLDHAHLHRSSVNTSPLSLIVLAAIAAGSLLTGLAGCGPPAEDDETSGQALNKVQINEVMFKNASRFVKLECGRVCLQTVREDSGRINPKTGEEIIVTRCVRYSEEGDCNRNVLKVTLHASSDAAHGNEAFPPAMYPMDDPPYLGCGVTAAQNVAWWYGRYISIQDTARHVETFRHGESLATSPTNLARDLKRILDEAFVTHQVVRRSGINILDIRNELLRGSPVPILVNGGHHWMTVVGYEAPDKLMVMDYAHSKPYWETIGNLKLDLSPLPGWGSFFDSIISVLPGVEHEGYYDRTIVTISRTEHPTYTSDVNGWNQSSGE